jgi:hypothetical protein
MVQAPALRETLGLSTVHLEAITDALPEMRQAIQAAAGPEATYYVGPSSLLGLLFSFRLHLGGVIIRTS